MTPDHELPGADSTPAASADDVLDCWKDIAAYLERDLRTVMRWEHTRGLPVHRLPGGPKPAVYALKSELLAWRAAGVALANEKEGQESAEERSPEPPQPVCGPAAAALRPPRAHRPVILTVGLLFLAVAATGLVVWRLRTSAPPPIESLAVLPFANLTGDSAQDYFADGIHEMLITDLARQSGVRVISRTSASHYRASRMPAGQIVRELQVDALVEGSVLRIANRVRITAQLIRGDTDEHVWAASYDRDVGDVLRLMAEVTEAISGEIQNAVAGSQRRGADTSKSRAVRPESLDSYLRARYEFQSLTAEGLERALKIYRATLESDPAFALAWNGIASARVAQTFFGIVPPAQALPEAREAARRALALDERMGEAYGALGYIALYWDWDFDAAGGRLKRALELSPNSSAVRHEYADYLLVRGKFDESVEQTRIGHRDDPLSQPARGVLLYHALMARRYDEVIAEGRRLVQAGQLNPTLRDWMGRARWLQGRHAEAMAEWKAAFGSPSTGYPDLEDAYGRGGPKAALMAQAMWNARLANAGRKRAIEPAVWFAAAGEANRALEWLETAYARRDPLLLHIIVDPFFDPIRSDPRFEALLQRIGIHNANR